ncbi:MAG: hypothetical protein JSR26_00855 [Proteobacteria bacterium]|nr:hypothetical protein [Pseudomonadota bacterium]
MMAAAGGALAQAPAFAIASPKAGATVTSPVSVVVTVAGVKLGKSTDGLSHLHLSVDGGPTKPVYKEGPVRFTLPPGKHTLHVELAGPTHQPLLPAQSVTFTVKK